MYKVQSFITNISFPKSLEEFLYFLNLDFYFDLDEILNKDYVEWTAPNWAKVGDIVFFMHTKTANATISRLKKAYLANYDEFNKEERCLIERGLKHAYDNYHKYGGKIFAVGKVVSPNVYGNFYDKDVDLHFKGRIFAPISDIKVLENPIDISEFNSFILVSRQSAITGIFSKEFMQLKELIKSKNEIPKYFDDSISTPLPLKDVDQTNWIKINRAYRRSFFLESQFRSYYTDYLLKYLSDKNLYKECPCKSKNKPYYFIDNVITINNKFLLVEIKLNIEQEKDIIKQMKQYIEAEAIILNKRIIERNRFYNKALIIDTYGIYLFNNDMEEIKLIFDLDDLKTVSDINALKAIIINTLS